MMMLEEEDVLIPVKTGVVLKGVMRRDIRTDIGVLLVHPHSKFGGSQRNKIIVTIAFCLAAHHYTTLSIDLRGVNNSSGRATWGGWDEREDVVAATQWFVRSGKVKAVYIVGYSFGAAIGAGVAELLPEVRGYVAISYPCGFWVRFLAGAHIMHARSHKPKMFITGSDDDYTSLKAATKVFEKLPEPKEMEVVQDIGHHWEKKEEHLAAQIAKYLDTCEKNYSKDFYPKIGELALVCDGVSHVKADKLAAASSAFPDKQLQEKGPEEQKQQKEQQQLVKDWTFEPYPLADAILDRNLVPLTTLAVLLLLVMGMVLL